jgi:hypothetical protein
MVASMKTIRIASEVELGFEAASRLSEAVARSLLGDELVCLSWYDRIRDHECPAHASECHDGSCPIPGYIEYAQSRGAQLRVVIAEGTFVFCFRSVEEFTLEQ